MSVKITKKEGGIVEITLDNGHAQALEKVTSDFNLLNEEKAVGFMLSVMRDADGKAIQTVNGSFVPTKEIKKPSEDDAPLIKEEDGEKI